ncbi:MAG: sugar ABC transporter ATP-binding protein [Atribacterota bacterium]
MRELRIDGIEKSFGAIKALGGVSLFCQSGEILGLVGANGSGKTTLSRIITGTIRPDLGNISIDGQRVQFHHPREARALGILMAHQNLSLIESMSIWENVVLDHEFLTPRKLLDNQQSRAFTAKWLQKFGLSIDVNLKVEKLSPDLRQMVEIIKAMSWDPNVLLLDEPTASLDHEKVKQVFEAIREEREKGKLIIFISHRINEVIEICDRVAVLRNGKNAGEIDLRNNHCDQRKIVELMVGEVEQSEQKKSCPEPGTTKQTPMTILEVIHLKVGDKVKDISLTLRQGEFLGIGGLQGHGQEEVLLALFGAISKSSGTIKLNGQETHFSHPSEAINAGIVLIPGDRQKEGLFLEQSILFNFFYPSLNTSKKRWVPYTDHRQKAKETFEQLRLVYAHLDQQVRYLSGGNQQKVVIGKWLTLQPRIILLNDPTKGVDVGARKEIYDLIHTMRAKGLSVILFASDNRELIENCDRVLVMYGGRIVDEVDTEEICESRLIASSLCVEW